MSVLVSVHAQVSALAVAAGPISTTPDPGGLPGGATAQRFLNGLTFYGLLACVGALVIGGATWLTASRAGNYTASFGGKTAVLGGVIGALVIGGAAALVNFFYGAGSAI